MTFILCHRLKEAVNLKCGEWRVIEKLTFFIRKFLELKKISVDLT